MCQILKFIIVSVVINVTVAKVAPDFIGICPGLKSECLKKTIQEAIPKFAKGIPELGVITTDPLRDDNVKLELPGAFKVQLNNGTLTGLRKCVVDKVKFENDEADMVLRCNVTIKGRYKATGRILIVSIDGDGDAKIKSSNILITGRVKFEDKVRDGVTYYDVKEYKIKHEFGDKVTFSLTNLFKGNPELSEVVLQFLNQNWKQVSEEFGGPIFDRLVNIVFGTIKEFFKNVPKDEIIAN